MATTLIRTADKAAEYHAETGGYFTRFAIKEASHAAYDFVSDFKRAVNNQDAAFVAIEPEGRAFYVGTGYAQKFETTFKAEFN